ncbi:MAG: 16S rRNA (cytidine(1402)-2'-O)-methyltransferase [candidate division Zixibacteria bacterium]|nr:16S rRNA (cytidine(1402)-2'-O)-methyltransferase [candidate division Zixibacteria bacterium]
MDPNSDKAESPASGGEVCVEPGVLYLVSTPIGNLEDITLRALRVLKEVDLVAAEDTRHTGILLKHYNLKKSLTSYHDFNKERKAPLLIKRLKANQSVAVTSDAGTPGISDPGYYLVQLAIQNDIKVVPIPGASAFLSALVVSGLPTDRFVFEGFLPAKPGKRRKKLEKLQEEERTLILYESPHRFAKTLDDISEILGQRRMVVARELTKKFEEILRGTPEEIKQSLGERKLKGELVILIEGKLDLKRY